MSSHTPSLRIGIVARDYPPMRGGIARYTEDLARFLSRQAPVEVFLYGGESDWTGAWEKPAGVTRHVLGAATPAEAAPTLLKLLKKIGVSHVLFNHTLTASVPLVIRCRRAGIRPYMFVYGADIGMRMGGKTWLARYVLFALQRRMLTISRATRSVFRRKFPFLPSGILAPGIDMPAQETPRHGLGTGIVAVGRLVQRKGFDVLLQAVGLLVGRGVDCKLTIIGNGPDAQRLEGIVSDLRLAEQVTFLRDLSDREVQEQLAQHRIFCLLPRVLADGDMEGFGIVFLEAAAAGLPVVAGRSGGVVEAVNEGQNGFLVEPENPVQAAARIQQLLGDDALCARMGQASRQWAARFDWSRRSVEQECAFLRDGVL